MTVAEIVRTNASRGTASQTLAGSAIDRPVCTICADTMIAAEASAFVGDDAVTHLWTCDTCGYGMVTRHLVDPAERR